MVAVPVPPINADRPTCGTAVLAAIEDKRRDLEEAIFEVETAIFGYEATTSRRVLAELRSKDGGD